MQTYRQLECVTAAPNQGVRSNATMAAPIPNSSNRQHQHQRGRGASIISAPRMGRLPRERWTRRGGQGRAQHNGCRWRLLEGLFISTRSYRRHTAIPYVNRIAIAVHPVPPSRSAEYPCRAVASGKVAHATCTHPLEPRLVPFHTHRKHRDTGISTGTYYREVASAAPYA